jgi:hypothetical protein
MSLKNTQENYFRELKMLSSSALAGLLESITTSLFHDSIKSAVLKHVLFLPILSIRKYRNCNLCIL